MHLLYVLYIKMAFANGCLMLLAPGGSWTTVGEPSPWEQLEEEYFRQ